MSMSRVTVSAASEQRFLSGQAGAVPHLGVDGKGKNGSQCFFSATVPN